MTNERQHETEMEELKKIFRQLVELSAETIDSAKILENIKESDDKNEIVKQLNKIKELDNKREELTGNLLTAMVCVINSHDKHIAGTDEKLEKIITLLEQIHEKLNASIETSECMINIVKGLY